jgi:hypothetical protein
MAEYQQQYFDDRAITVVAGLSQNKHLKATACFGAAVPDGGSIASGKHDRDDGEQFKAEVKRLMNVGAYDPLL